MFESRKVFGALVLTRWQDFPEGGETLESLQNKLYEYYPSIPRHDLELFREGFQQYPMWGMAFPTGGGFQFRHKRDSAAPSQDPAPVSLRAVEERLLSQIQSRVHVPDLPQNPVMPWEEV